MRKITCFTSFNETYYNHTGKIFLDTWLKFWDDSFDLVIYAEDFKLKENTRYTQIPFTELHSDYNVFQKEKHKEATKRFAKKGYSVIHGMEHIDTDILIWLDADTITKEPVNLEFFEDIIPNSILSAHLGVMHNMEKHNPKSPMKYSCETGFFALNKNHNLFKQFVELYKNRYFERKFNDLRRPYDGDVYGAVVEELSIISNNLMNDINPDRHRTPFDKCILKDKFHHFKHRAKLTPEDDFKKHYEQYLINLEKKKEKARLKKLKKSGNS